jgi:hypothetical protein
MGDAGMSAVGGWFVDMLSAAHGVADFSDEDLPGGGGGAE